MLLRHLLARLTGRSGILPLRLSLSRRSPGNSLKVLPRTSSSARLSSRRGRRQAAQCQPRVRDPTVPECASCAGRSIFPGHSWVTSSNTAVLPTDCHSSTIGLPGLPPSVGCLPLQESSYDRRKAIGLLDLWQVPTIGYKFEGPFLDLRDRLFRLRVGKYPIMRSPHDDRWYLELREPIRQYLSLSF